jgi:HAD superfamily hydrolase (TIGR01509 family)
MIHALISDFDGLILDTEGPILRSWQEVYCSFGFELPLDLWATIVGTYEADFDPYRHLEHLHGRPVDWEAIEPRRRARETELILSQPLLPGVAQYLIEAQTMSLKLGLASSSTRDWVAGHLGRLGLLNSFDVIRCKEDVERTKPDPALFLAALRALGLQPGQAIVLEDSLNGILAAKRAGIFAVAVPNPLTRHMDLSAADLLLESLAAMPLEALLRAANGHLRK